MTQAGIRRRATIASGLALLLLPAAGATGQGTPGDFAVGSGSNEFIVVLGDARLSIAAQSDSGGALPSGHVRGQGDPDGAGPNEPFTLEGEVTCLQVRGNRAAIKYRFKHAEGSAEPFAGGGVQIFVEDNGDPDADGPVDRATFDPPQAAGVFDLDAGRCDDPNTRAGYDPINSGDFGVHDAP